MTGRKVTGVDLHYVPWDDDGSSQWCPRISIHGEDASVEVVLGDSHDGMLVPSADNVAVLHPRTGLPNWCR